ncbi:hypothetical protein FHR22_002248 [Sphingopyxis panaciterrae]|uniref:hypothetical protein n=1 Tax=Sphingopyxis panaciterrae TaxID=363841 RepID=UPI001422541E|nr:hypothetical protein [Sphingopyxis panaciterrae]NIJ37564.1 hypothetical protein [Sphingopyxis panaciterrae]
MKKLLLGLSAMLLVTPVAAQQGPPQGREGGMGRGRPQEGGPPRMRAIEPVGRERFDRIVTDMFRAADSDRNKAISIDEAPRREGRLPGGGVTGLPEGRPSEPPPGE